MSFLGTLNPTCLLKAGVLYRISAAIPLKAAAVATQEWQQIHTTLVNRRAGPPSLVSRVT